MKKKIRIIALSIDIFLFITLNLFIRTLTFCSIVGEAPSTEQH